MTVTRTAVAAAATVTDVAFTNLPSDNVYDLGEVIEVSVTFSEAVEVLGMPRVRLELFAVDEYAAYTRSASTSTVLVFHYTVTGAVDDTQTSVVSQNGLDLNTGMIRNQGTVVDADLLMVA